jgi:hypothetical protein
MSFDPRPADSAVTYSTSVPNDGISIHRVPPAVSQYSGK